MKTLIIKLSKLIFLLPLFLFAGCEKEKIADLELSETKLSNLSASIGIDTITRLENDNTSTNYKINGRKIIINDFEVNLKEANFKIEKVGDDFNITLDLKSKGSKIIVNYYIFHSQKKIFKRVNGRLVAIENLINQKREETLVFVAMEAVK